MCVGLYNVKFKREKSGKLFGTLKILLPNWPVGIQNHLSFFLLTNYLFFSYRPLFCALIDLKIGSSG